jgi:glycosyltransferase involved in cell wall biosynthesis
MISVIIPVYNRTEELKRAVISVINQTFKNWELLVVDDYSEKDIKAIVNSFSDDRINYYRLDKKGNANVCRNLGIKNAKGEYIAMLDSDDEWLPKHLEKSLQLLNILNVDGLFSSYKVFDGETYRNAIIRSMRDNESMLNYILDGNSAATPTHFYKSNCAKEILWDEEFQRHQDYDFAIRFAEKYTFLPVQLFTVIVHWKKNEKRNEHLPSQIRFVEMYKKQMNKKLFLKYNRETLALLFTIRNNDSNIIYYFRNNILSNIKELSLVDFMSIYGNNISILKKIHLLLKFIFLILFS